MGLGHTDYPVRTGKSTREATRETWLEMLRQWLVQCPQCAEVRLVVGAQEHDRYVCKDCGHSFIISHSMASKA